MFREVTGLSPIYLLFYMLGTVSGFLQSLIHLFLPTTLRDTNIMLHLTVSQTEA